MTMKSILIMFILKFMMIVGYCAALMSRYSFSITATK